MARTRTLTAVFALARLAFGAGLAASPERMASPWLGGDVRRPPVQIAVRAMGMRDIALSAGALATIDDREALRLWIAGAVLSDVGDVTATLLTPSQLLPSNARWGTVALGGGSALAGLALLRGLTR